MGRQLPFHHIDACRQREIGYNEVSAWFNFCYCLEGLESLSALPLHGTLRLLLQKKFELEQRERTDKPFSQNLRKSKCMEL